MAVELAAIIHHDQRSLVQKTFERGSGEALRMKRMDEDAVPVSVPGWDFCGVSAEQSTGDPGGAGTPYKGLAGHKSKFDLDLNFGRMANLAKQRSRCFRLERIHTIKHGGLRVLPILVSLQPVCLVRIV